MLPYDECRKSGGRVEKNEGMLRRWKLEGGRWKREVEKNNFKKKFTTQIGCDVSDYF